MGREGPLLIHREVARASGLGSRQQLSVLLAPGGGKQGCLARGKVAMAAYALKT